MVLVLWSSEDVREGESDGTFGGGSPLVIVRIARRTKRVMRIEAVGVEVVSFIVVAFFLLCCENESA
jgi:hypothetical protein